MAFAGPHFDSVASQHSTTTSLMLCVGVLILGASESNSTSALKITRCLLVVISINQKELVPELFETAAQQPIATPNFWSMVQTKDSHVGVSENVGIIPLIGQKNRKWWR